MTALRYDDLKEFAFEIAEISAGSSDSDAKKSGYSDIYDFIMSDRDHSRHLHFLIAITHAFTPAERRLLLNGLAREYAGAAGWLDYCDQHPSRNGKAAKLSSFNQDTFG